MREGAEAPARGCAVSGEETAEKRVILLFAAHEAVAEGEALSVSCRALPCALLSRALLTSWVEMAAPLAADVRHVGVAVSLSSNERLLMSSA